LPLGHGRRQGPTRLTLKMKQLIGGGIDYTFRRGGEIEVGVKKTEPMNRQRRGGKGKRSEAMARHESREEYSEVLSRRGLGEL